MQPHEPLYTLIGHTANVCALAVTPTGHIVSGSWDKTVIVWKDFQLAYTLKGHEAAVWAVLPLNDDTILTAAADKTIRLWNQDKQIKVLQGHTDAVRGLARVPNFGFVSCANDGTLRVWTESGECMQELNGHTSFVYSVAVLGSGEFVSSGEDRTVRIWKDGQCVQTLQQPCISVWTVATLPNDDIIEFDTLLANQAIPSNQIGDINKEKLPGMEALNTPGQKEGQVIMVNVPGGAVEAHQWSGQTQTWQKIGEVVGGVGSGKKQIYDGQEYDYVFDIDIGNGPSGMLKLPYNVTQNPYDAAQKFLWKHELPQMYLDEVANFIIKNAEGVELGTSSTNYADPFTGGNRYTPTQRPPSSTSGAGFSDPFTGNLYNVGGSSYRNPSAQSVPATKGPVPRSAILPLNSYLALKQTNLDAIHTKLQTLNQNNQSVALSDAELTALGKAIQFLKAGSVGMMDSDGMQVIVKLCDQWSVNQRFPGLDLLRLCTLYAPESVASAVPTGDVPGFICSAGGLANGVVGDKIAETNAMLAYRALANLFNQAEGRHMAWNSKNTIAEVLQIDIVMNFKGKMARLAISTLAIK
ncbi:WD40-repeat-containing domain protein [Radiomyces spectabilis]|uniref:WD40-repeat-containing domain protein n=1 Tax=Radiomyces spectabilis TaxID=64574 RepID=UPI00221F20A0|nr:WD40-repeat-containing domain protein [Radiomyces spectabilis]KAI8372759.1 WD40-repeat-containing domain protein [Radiomyces spectabilis]